MCRKSPDEGGIAIGEYQIVKAKDELKEKGEPDLTISLFHHPLQWLWEEDKNRLKTYLDKTIILSGHLHDVAGGRFQDFEGGRYCFQAGGAYLGSESDWPARYQYITFDFGKDEIRLDFRKYVKGRRIWSVDGETGKDGHKIFDKAGIKKVADSDQNSASTANSTSPKTIQTPQPLIIPENYNKWLKQECSYMQAEKMAGKGQVVRPELPEVFVPLYANEPVKESKAKKNKKASAEAFEEKSRVMDLETMIARNDYLLIEGQAGSGKTTLLKHLAYVLAEGNGIPNGLEGFLPVIVFLRTCLVKV